MKIGYRREDIDFVLDNYQDLREGIDPDPEYDNVKRSSSRYHAPGIVLMEMAGEISARVKMCGQDGMLVEERYGMNTAPPMTKAQIEKSRHIDPPPMTEAQIGKTRHIDLYEVCRRINRVKWFCVGRTRKIGGYEAWKRRTRRYPYYQYKQKETRPLPTVR